MLVERLQVPRARQHALPHQARINPHCHLTHDASLMPPLRTAKSNSAVNSSSARNPAGRKTPRGVNFSAFVRSAVDVHEEHHRLIFSCVHNRVRYIGAVRRRIPGAQVQSVVA
jgi:hypothetical protein